MDNIKLTICLLLTCIVIGCGQPKPINLSDGYVFVDIKREFAKQKFEDPVKSSDFITVRTSKFVMHDIRGIVVVPIIMCFYPFEHLIRHSGRTHIFIWPEGHRDYRQKITWGRNKVYIPYGLKNNIFRFVVEADGRLVGEVKVMVRPDQESIKLKE